MVEIDHNRFAVEILRGNARINLTQMAKPFGNSFKPSFWLRTDEAQRYLSVLSELQKCNTADLLEVRHGGTPELQGTWCNDRRIALRFAQWLDPKFSIVVDEALMRLMMGDAVFAEPINGVEPIISEGRAWYNYRDVMESFRLSRNNNPSRRKKAVPHCFKKIYGRNFICKEYFLTMQAYYNWINSYRQLELPLCFDTSL